MMRQALQSACDRLFSFHDLAAFISIRGFFVSFIVPARCWPAWSGLVWLWAGQAAGSRWIGEESASARRRARSSYRRLAQLLAAFGLERPSGRDPARVRPPRQRVPDRAGVEHRRPWPTSPAWSSTPTTGSGSATAT